MNGLPEAGYQTFVIVHGTAGAALANYLGRHDCGWGAPVQVRTLAWATLALSIAGTASAQDSLPPPDAQFGVTGEDVVLELGGGVLVQPAYEGANDYELGPWPLVDLKFLRVPGLFTVGGRPEDGLILSPSFRVVGERRSEDYDDLEGLDDVDLAVELGGTVGYRYEMVRGFVSARRGFGGHEGFVGEVGADLVMAPTTRIALSVGPRLNFASSDYMDTYFGVSEGEAANSDFAEFDADGGLKGLEAEAEARYALTPNWSVVGSAGFERLVGDAADSPVVEEGSRNQFTAGLGLTYRFRLDVFD
jgi:outer membrane scaffolding protein for murein synthesis (MipA/OmpV family)